MLTVRKALSSVASEISSQRISHAVELTGPLGKNCLCLKWPLDDGDDDNDDDNDNDHDELWRPSCTWWKASTSV